jgi:hypothetical protein
MDFFNFISIFYGQNFDEKNGTSMNITYENEYDETLLKVDTWLTVGLSTVSCLSLVFFTIVYVITHIKSRTKSKLNKKTALKKIYKNEYLVLSYCFSLFFSHLVSIAHKLIITYFVFNGYENIRSYCLVVGTLKHFFWLTTMFHSNVVSFKVYKKLSKAKNTTVLTKKNRFRVALKIFSYIYGSAFLLITISLLIHFLGKEHNVYELKNTDKLNCCFLSQPIYLVTLFTLPIGVILFINSILFLIVFIKTRKTIHKSENDEMNYLFLKLAVIMGLSWTVYIICIFIIEIFTDHLLVQTIIIVASCQINLQGLVIVLGLFSNSAYQKFFKKPNANSKTPAGLPIPVPIPAMAIMQNQNQLHANPNQFAVNTPSPRQTKSPLF